MCLVLSAKDESDVSIPIQASSTLRMIMHSS